MGCAKRSGSAAAVGNTAAALIAGVLAGAPAAAPAQGAVCSDPSRFCGRSVQASCLTRFGAGAERVAAEDASCRQELDLYRDCLALIAAQCPQRSPTAPSGGATRAGALEIWNEIKGVDDPEVLESFANSYPDSPLAVLARKRAAALRRAAEQGAEPPAPAGPTREEIAAREAEERAEAERRARLRAQFKEAQGHLNRAGYAAGPADGVWGARSRNALNRFLAAKGRSPEGVLSPASLALLRAAPTAPKPQPAPKPAAPRPKSAKESSKQESPKQQAPKPDASPYLATVAFAFIYSDGTSVDCKNTIEVPSKALRFGKRAFDCDRETFLTLRTDETGRATGAAAVEFDWDEVGLRGQNWEFQGSRPGNHRNPNELTDAVVEITFAER